MERIRVEGESERSRMNPEPRPGAAPASRLAGPERPGRINRSQPMKPPDPPDLSEPGLRLLEIATGSWMTRVVRTALALGLPGGLAAGPQPTPELAARLGCPETSLRRLLRALVTLGLCEEHAGDRYALTPTGDLLRPDVPGSLEAYILWWTDHLGPVWDELAYALRTGRSARERVLGTRGFAHLEEPAVAALFHRAMAQRTRLITSGVLAAFDFSTCRKVVDVGGGHGDLLAAILSAHPACEGVLFDLAHAVEGARRRFDESGLAGRVSCRVGDFFETVPPGGDLYLLKNVLHDWDDTQAGRILRNIARAIAPGGRVLVLECMLPERPGTGPLHRETARCDLNMLAAHGACERTEGAFAALLAAAGFRAAPARSVGGGLGLIEACVEAGPAVPAR